MELDDALLSDEATYNAIGASLSDPFGYETCGRLVCTDSRLIHTSDRSDSWMDIVYEDIIAVRHTQYPTRRNHWPHGVASTAIGALLALLGTGELPVDVVSVPDATLPFLAAGGLFALVGIALLLKHSEPVEELVIQTTNGEYTFRSREEASLKAAAEAVRMGRDAVDSASFGTGGNGVR